MEKIVLRRKQATRTCLKELDIITGSSSGPNPLADLLLRLFPGSEVSVESCREGETVENLADSLNDHAAQGPA